MYLVYFKYLDYSVFGPGRHSNSQPSDLWANTKTLCLGAWQEDSCLSKVLFYKVQWIKAVQALRMTHEFAIFLLVKSLNHQVFGPGWEAIFRDTLPSS